MVRKGRLPQTSESETAASKHLGHPGNQGLQLQLRLSSPLSTEGWLIHSSGSTGEWRGSCGFPGPSPMFNGGQGAAT